MVQGTWNPFNSPAPRWQGIWPQIHLNSQQKSAESQLAIWIRQWWSRYSLGLTGGFSPQRQKQMSSALVLSQDLGVRFGLSHLRNLCFLCCFLLLLSAPHLCCKLHHTLQRPYSCPPSIAFGVPEGLGICRRLHHEKCQWISAKTLISEEGKYDGDISLYQFQTLVPAAGLALDICTKVWSQTYSF